MGSNRGKIEVENLGTEECGQKIEKIEVQITCNILYYCKPSLSVQ